MSKKKHGTQNKELQSAEQSGLQNKNPVPVGRQSSPQGDEEREGRGVRPSIDRTGNERQERVRSVQEIEQEKFAEELQEAASKVIFMLDTPGWKDIVAPYMQANREELSDLGGIADLETLVAHRAVIQFIDQLIATLEDAKIQGEIARDGS